MNTIRDDNINLSIEAKLNKCSDDALETIDRLFPESHWPYHNGRHGRMVGRDAVRLCVYLDLPPLDRSIARLAGHAHDIIQTYGMGSNEALSASWLDYRMSQYQLPQNIIKIGALAVYSTKPVIINPNAALNQAANYLIYPDKRTELIARSVASADFSELYTPQGPLLGHMLFKEIHGVPQTEEDFNSLKLFQQRQVALFSGYRFPLPAAERLFTTYKSETIKHSESLLQKMESSAIDSWDQLIELDGAFAASLN